MDALDYALLSCPRPPPPGFGPLFPGGSGDAMHMDRTLGLQIPDRHGPCWSDDLWSVGAMHSNPFSFKYEFDCLAWQPSPAAGEPWNPFTVVEDSRDRFCDLDLNIPAPWDDHQYGCHAAEPPVDDSVPVPTTPPAETDDAAGDHDDIDVILRAKERRAEERPLSCYLETTQQGARMGPETRAALVLWIERATNLFDTVPGTLHRAVLYFDRFLSARALLPDDDDVDDGQHRQLHLLVAAAVYVAAKYESQLVSMSADQLAALLDCGTTARDVLDMERALLIALDYRLGGPTAFTFVDRFTERCYAGEKDEEVLRRTAHRFADLSLLRYDFLKLAPSAVAAAAIFLARLTTKPSYGDMRTWNRQFGEVTGYKPSDLDLKHTLEPMCELMRQVEPKLEVDIFPFFLRGRY